MNNIDPIQRDMFASFDATQVATSVKTPATTSGIPTLVEYANKIAMRVWPKEHTRNHNLRGCRWFSEYKDFGQLTLADIRRKHIYEFVEHLMSTRGITQNSANKYMAAISAVLREANEYEVVDNPIKLKYAKVVAKRPKAFTPQEEAEAVEYLREAGQGWLADMLILSINSGMRKGEILQINRPDVTLSSNGKWLYLPEDACKAGERKVPLNSNARAAYERLKPVIDDVYTPGLFRWWMNKVRRDVGRGDKHFVFHVGRHTTATRLASNKENEFNIADIMGHQDTRTTRRYVHLEDEALLSAVENI